MDDSESMCYCPDFSDVYAASVVHNEDYSFWDFLKNSEEECNMSSKQENSKIDVCFVDHSDNLPTVSLKIKHDRNKLQDISRAEAIVKDSDLCGTNTDERHKKDEKKLSNNDEDEFWDFLKSDVSSDQINASLNQAFLTPAEFADTNSLSSVTPLSLNESNASCHTGISNCAHSNNKIVDSGDDFWDFLKSDVSSDHVNASLNKTILSPAELVERSSLFSVSSVSLSESPASWTSHGLSSQIESYYCNRGFRCFNHSNKEKSSHRDTTDKCIPSEEIHKDLNQMISEIDLAHGMSKNTAENNILKEQLHSTNVLCANSIANRVIDTVSNLTTTKNNDKKAFYFHESSKTDSPYLVLKKRQAEDRKNKTKAPQNIGSPAKYSNYQAVKKKVVNTENKINSVLLTGSHFLHEEHDLNHKIPVSNNTIVQTDTNVNLQMTPEQVSSMKMLSGIKKTESNTHVPVTTSITDSSCPIVFPRQNEAIEELQLDNIKNFNESYTRKNFESAPSDQNSLLNSIHSSSLSSHAMLETNFKADSVNENTSCPQVPKFKRHIKQNSPKNSVFRITDSQPTINNIQPFENTVIDKINCKKQKFNVISSVYNQKNCNSENDQKGYPIAPLKYVILPTSTGTNKETVFNPHPLYLIIPENYQTGTNQNAELVMLIDNNNLNTNNSKINESIPSTTCSLSTPVTWSSRILPNQPSYPAFPTAGIQNLNASIPNVITLQQNLTTSKASDNSKFIFKTDSMTKPVSINTNKLQPSVDTAFNLINSHTLPQSFVNVNSMNICTTSTSSSLNVNGISVPHSNHLTIPTIMNNTQFNISAPQKEQRSEKIPVKKNSQSINFIPLLPNELVQLQSLKQIRPQNLKPLKSISLGRDKNAIQQISVPLKMDSLVSPDVLSSVHNLSSLANSYTCNALHTHTVQNKIDEIIKISDEQLVPEKQQISYLNNRYGLFSSVQKQNLDGVLGKNNLITSNTEVVNSNKLLTNYQSCTQPTVISSVNENKKSDFKSFEKKLNYSVVNLQENKNFSNLTSMDILKSTSNFKSPGKNTIFPNVSTIKIESVCSLSQIPPNKSANNAIATLQELFPPPITMIPVSVTTTAPSQNKVSGSQVLVLQSSSSLSNRQIIKKNQRETELKKTTPMKSKKLGRKTVRQLLEERYKHTNMNRPSNVLPPREQTKVLRPIYKLAGNGTLLPITVNDGAERSLDSVSSNSNYLTKTNPNIAGQFKRPNIMMLPSAAKCLKGNNFKEKKSEKSFEIKGPLTAGDDSLKTLDIPQDLLINKMTKFKDHKPRCYDMSELCIGYFKVVDDAEACGRYRSKFKVIFTRRQFLYEFPISKGNQVDLNTSYSSDQVVRIQVSFQSLVAMNVHNRRIDILIKGCPQLCMKKSEERSNLTLKDSSKDNNFLTGALQNSLLHKITLRRRQADYLKCCLCQFDPSFNSLFEFGKSISAVVESPFEDEVVTANLRKVYQQNKKTAIRRLPQWDAKDVLDQSQFKNDKPSLSPNQTCSCRISCKSLRCSCVKVVKSCGSGGTACLCTNCDNPLNILDSFGINLDFSLNDCCLFQNIYRIPKLRPFLSRCVKLSCCNTVARVVDCIPGTILCPNTECNESLEFSWCQGIICYPDRNPRNHCSFCGLCCFSNKRHCQICNRCYIVTPKCPDCPNCRGTGFVMKPNDQEYMGDNCQSMRDITFRGESASSKPSSKPKIIVLDSVLSTKDMPEIVTLAEMVIKEQNVESKAEVKNEEDVKLEEDPPAVGNSKELKEAIFKNDDCKDFSLKKEDTQKSDTSVVKEESHTPLKIMEGNKERNTK